MLGQNDKKEIEEIIQRGQKDLETLARLQQTALDKLPATHIPQVSKAMADFNNALRATRNGDADAINKIISKYANINR